MIGPMALTRREFLASTVRASPRPNVVLMLADDMGFDLGCYGGEIPTPSLDRLAGEGIRFGQAYVASPICSPSRVGITTGQQPARRLIFSYLDSRKRQRELGMRDWLDTGPPLIARAFQDAGYATAHFGKWHMGGGRDVGDAPLPAEYGFDESLTSFEGLGDRVLPPGALSEQSARLGRGVIRRAPQADLTGIYVDHALDFIGRRRGHPFYLQLWTNDVHDPFTPKPERMKKYARFAMNKHVQQYYAMLDEMDAQLGRLIDGIDKAGLAEHTIVIFLSDNGPTAWPRYYKEGLPPPGRTGGLRGRKWSLYEGGIRVPFIARWKGRIPAGRVDNGTVLSSLDIFPSLCRLAGIEPPAVDFDGEDMSAALLGRPKRRQKDLFWEYGRDQTYIYPGDPRDRSPNLALRSGNWKLLVNDDGGGAELYDLTRTPDESQDLAAREPGRAGRMAARLLQWRRSLPRL